MSYMGYLKSPMNIVENSDHAIILSVKACIYQPVLVQGLKLFPFCRKFNCNTEFRKEQFKYDHLPVDQLWQVGPLYTPGSSCSKSD